MNRSGKLRSKHDALIEEMINDPHYRILPDGTIETLITRAGNVSANGTWRKSGYKSKRNGKVYYCAKYKKRELSIHRIIYRAFVGPLAEDLVINHLDGDPGNNHPSNLELITQSENNTHRYRILGHPGVKGNTKITQTIADAIRFDRAQGLTYPELVQKYGVCKSNISYIINNKTWIAPTPIKRAA